MDTRRVVNHVQDDEYRNSTLTVGLTEDFKNKYADHNVWLIEKWVSTAGSSVRRGGERNADG
jgi:hypothetical protein